MTWLLDLLVRSSTILLLGLAVLALLRRHSAALRHWILFATLVCAAVVPAASWLLPSWDPPIDIAAIVPQSWTTRMPIVAIDRPRTADLTAPVSSAVTPGSGTPAGGDTLLQLWLVGSVLSLGTLMVGLLRLRIVDRDATPVNGVWSEMIAQRQSRTEAVVVRATTRPGLLLVWGVVRPTIIVPVAALSWSAERIAAVLDHEFAHIRRQDWLVQIISEIIRAVYWFNPLVWIACARLRAECEVACDDVVITSGSSGTTYAMHVVDVARELKTEYWLPAPAVARASTLERRVRSMLDKTLNRQPVSGRSRGGALAILAVVTLTIAAAAQSFVSLSGTIVDPSNGVLPGVRLILTNQDTQAKYEIKTDRNGKYEFVGLPPGNYTMEAALPGFARFSGAVMVATQNLQQDVAMSLGMLQETITIVAEPTDTASVVTVSPEVLRKIEERRKKVVRPCPSLTTSDGAPIGGNIRTPMKLRDVKPVYPVGLRETSGQVVLLGRLNTEGVIDDIDVISTTHQEFTDATVAAVSQWQFDATVLNCEPVPVKVQVTANYTVR